LSDLVRRKSSEVMKVIRFLRRKADRRKSERYAGDPSQSDCQISDKSQTKDYADCWPGNEVRLRNTWGFIVRLSARE
jgi:hypothetical protein